MFYGIDDPAYKLPLYSGVAPIAFTIDVKFPTELHIFQIAHENAVRQDIRLACVEGNEAVLKQVKGQLPIRIAKDVVDGKTVFVQKLMELVLRKKEKR